MDDKAQTKYSFQEKWKSSHDFQSGGIESFDKSTLNWILTRNGFNSLDEFSQFLKRFPVLLDAGCGNGRVLGLIADLSNEEQQLFGIDLAAADIARENLRNQANVVVEQADLMDFQSLESVCRPDFIYCQEVLHHTSSPQTSFENLVRLLNTNGEIAIYVYKEKAPIREFTDDYVRDQIMGLDHKEATELMSQFAELGRVLSILELEVDIPEVSLLGIRAGRYDIQRFIYHHFLKCYWNAELSHRDNTMINFDWYHPSLCYRHTVEEVRGWFDDCNLEIVQECVDEYGITMRGKKC
jgi:SAM-dependent methyltransferase